MAIGGGGSFSSDQTTLQKDTGAISLLRAGRARVTSIQGRGEAGSVILLHDAATTGGATAGNLKATFKYDTEGLDIYVPGNGIRFETTIYADVTGTGSITLGYTG